MTGFPEISPPRPLWLMTLADLALLLLGFLTLIQATAAPRRDELVRGLREAWGGEAPAPMPVAARAVRFPAGSARAATAPDLLAWVREAARDPRVAFTVTGSTDGSAADADPATGSPALLAADRARAVGAMLAGAVPRDRLRLATNPAPRGRVATVSLSFAGERP